MAIHTYTLEQLAVWKKAHDGIEALGVLLKVAPEVTDTIAIDKNVFANLRANTQHLPLWHQSKIFIPTESTIYLRNGGNYRIAVTPRIVIYGRVTDIDAELNKKTGYKNLEATLKLSTNEKDISKGVFSLFFDANPRLQKLTEKDY